ncbi:putative toxin-antitoxin system toxin component, PIN family [Patescibacteria group bacterium]|nr:putative toxin-antitoxin system toxin component, PIN family [Patescibacteria group bacterium]
MNVILDTNILISAITLGGKPGLILDLAVEQRILAFTSETLIIELKGVLINKFKYSPQRLNQIENTLHEHFTIAHPTKVPSVISRDPDDNHVLAITHMVDIDYIISGDKDLFILGSYNKTLIINPAEFLERYSRP